MVEECSMESYIYICNNFTGNKIHSEMILSLSEKHNDKMHYVFVPCSSEAVVGNNRIKADNVFIEYICVNKYLRFFPFIKSLIVLFFILRRARLFKINWKNSVALSYTFWSDGVLCLYLYLIFGTSFSTFVRVTDISIFFKYGYHLRILFYFIANKSQYIYFPSIALKEEAGQYRFLKNNSGKSFFLPNPLNNYWVDNIYEFDNLSKSNKKILFVGSFDSNKNILAVFKSVSILYKYRKDFKVEFIGGDEKDFKRICKIDVIPKWISISNKIQKEELLLKYRSANILLVPSFLETFGMVYLEAISQGCIAVCSNNQGVDGLFKDEGVLYSVNPNDSLGIFNTLNVLLDMEVKISSSNLREILIPFSSTNVVDFYSCFVSNDF